MQFTAKTTDAGLLILPATPTDAIALTRLREAAATKAEAHIRERREWYLTQGPGKRLADARKQLDDTEEDATNLATRAIRLQDELASALQASDRAAATKAQSQIAATKAELDSLRAEARGLRPHLLAIEREVGLELRKFLAECRAEFIAEREARQLAALAAIAELVDPEEVSSAVESAAAVAGDKRIDRPVKFKTKGGVFRHTELYKLLTGTGQKVPEFGMPIPTTTSSSLKLERDSFGAPIIPPGMSRQEFESKYDARELEIS